MAAADQAAAERQAAAPGDDAELLRRRCRSGHLGDGGV
jgi:hypothetical protein